MVLFFGAKSLVFILHFNVTNTFNKCVLHDEFIKNKPFTQIYEYFMFFWGHNTWNQLAQIET